MTEAPAPRRSPVTRVARAIVRLPVRLYRRILGIDVDRLAHTVDHQGADVKGRIDQFQHQITYGYLEPTHELLDLTLRQLSRIEGGVEALTAATPIELSSRTYTLLNYEKSHIGFAAQAGLWMNHPIALEYTTDEVRWAYTNERVVEIPWVIQGLAELSPPARVLDIGPLESLVSLQLASLGYRVTALDVRPYKFSHPNLKVVVDSILDWPGDGQAFDAVVLLSTLEHIGIGVYGQAAAASSADLDAMERVRQLLRPGGVLVFTSPFGRSRVDETQRVYGGEDLRRLLKGFRVTRSAIATRVDTKTWNMEAIDMETLCGLEVPDDTERVALVVAERE